MVAANTLAYYDADVFTTVERSCGLDPINSCADFFAKQRGQKQDIYLSCFSAKSNLVFYIKKTCLNSKFHPKYIIPIQEHVLDTNARKQLP